MNDDQHELDEFMRDARTRHERRLLVMAIMVLALLLGLLAGLILLRP